MSFNFMYSDLDLERIGQAKEKEEMSYASISDAINIIYPKQLDKVLANAVKHIDKIPTFNMLLEEVKELDLALEGRHEHEPAYELIQIGGIVLNWLKQLDEAGR